MSHLNDIAVRQRSSRARDAIFAAFVGLGLLVTVVTVSTAAQAASRQAVPTSIASR